MMNYWWWIDADDDDEEDICGPSMTRVNYFLLFILFWRNRLQMNENKTLYVKKILK